jgi:acyltransferase
MANRFVHVDAMRGLAILCMVQVHTAALMPAPVSIDHPIALFSASIGGMAAPMFVLISGWALQRGLDRRRAMGESVLRWSLTRGGFLIGLQFLLGLLLPQRFDISSPGILTLLGICTLIFPLYYVRDAMSIRMGIDPRISRTLRAIFVAIFAWLIYTTWTNLQPGPTWTDMIHVKSILDWFVKAGISGTYPLLPWATYFIIGSILDEKPLEGTAKQKQLRNTGLIAFGSLSITAIISAMTEVSWAVTMGEGVLTFFPANPWFVLVSCSMSVFIWDLFRCINSPKWVNSVLAPSGRLSLTIYMLHFALLGVIEPYLPDSGLEVAFLMTIVHMTLWSILAHIQQKQIPELSIEHLLRKFSNLDSRQNENE